MFWVKISCYKIVNRILNWNVNSFQLNVLPPAWSSLLMWKFTLRIHYGILESVGLLARSDSLIHAPLAPIVLNQVHPPPFFYASSSHSETCTEIVRPGTGKDILPVCLWASRGILFGSGISTNVHLVFPHPHPLCVWDPWMSRICTYKINLSRDSFHIRD